ncbi:MAG: ABC transporter ATP-binding protein [Dehalococcoidia bacterium]|nr:ABC transporter ATP-binding protein [Dehalococcoidia bacterium]
MSVLFRLMKYAFRHKWYLVGAYTAMVASSLSALVVPRMLGEAIDEALASGLQSRLLTLAAVIVLFSILRGIFSYGQRYLSESLSQRSAYDLREDFFKKLQSMSFGFFDREQTGDLMSRATQDVEAVRTFVSMGMVRGLSIFVTMGAVSTLMAVTNWRLALVCMAFLPLILWRALTLSRALRPVWMRVQQETGAMTTVLQENLSGMKVVKAFGARDFEEAKFNARAENIARLTYSTTRLFASQGSLMTFIFTAATGAILWYGGREVAADRLTPGGLASFIFYMGLLAMPIRMSGWLMNTISRASSAGQRLYDILDAQSPVAEKPDATPLPRTDGHVVFENVAVSYDGGVSAVRGVDFEAHPGQLIALLGGPGSGKSTIAHVLPRFYDATEGRITIDGYDTRDVTLKSLRENVGIVMQDVFVFAATIRDNIAYGLDDVDMEDVVEAAKIAQLHDFIEGLPDGYDTWVGERGVTLSGGQRQRLAIARTILLDPPVIILDDSTSSVDMETEHRLQQALDEAVRGRTTFVIAHRLSTVRRADLILVLEDGEIVERGTHDELLERDGFYRRIYDMQLRPQDHHQLKAGHKRGSSPTARAEALGHADGGDA